MGGLLQIDDATDAFSVVEAFECFIDLLERVVVGNEHVERNLSRQILFHQHCFFFFW